MNNVLDLQETYISTLFGVMLLLVVIHNNRWRFNVKRRENKILFVLTMSVLIACILDCTIFYLDGKPGALNWYFLFVFNAAMYGIAMLLCCSWMVFIMQHLMGEIASIHLKVMNGALLLTCGILIYNFFNPVFFYINEFNQYVRGPYNDILFSIAVFLLLYLFFVYEYIIYRGGGLKFFPLTSFVLPIISGIVVQMLNYGILIIWPAAAISITGVILSLQNEMIFRDNLTGVYNRRFFDNIHTLIKKKHPFGLMFLDLNKFKEVNDQFGHKAGDEVLKNITQIMRKVARLSGTVIRYGGDEFIMLINTDDLKVMEAYVRRLNSEIATFNAESGKPYEISVAIGYCITTLQPENLAEAVREADQSMYKDKRGER